MSWHQQTLTLPSRSRGCYLITSEITSALPSISTYKVGLLNLFIQHTSCALSLNENYDEDVRADMGDALDRIVPEDKKGRGGKGLYRHDAEGSDDMPVSFDFLLLDLGREWK
jgi:secondary thiamine-phosphate synthase enzyme